MKVNKVYKFGIIPKSDTKDLDLILKYHNYYYNDLVQIKREKETFIENLAQ